MNYFYPGPESQTAPSLFPLRVIWAASLHLTRWSMTQRVWSWFQITYWPRHSMASCHFQSSPRAVFPEMRLFQINILNTDLKWNLKFVIVAKFCWSYPQEHTGCNLKLYVKMDGQHTGHFRILEKCLKCRDTVQNTVSWEDITTSWWLLSKYHGFDPPLSINTEIYIFIHVGHS